MRAAVYNITAVRTAFDWSITRRRSNCNIFPAAGANNVKRWETCRTLQSYCSVAGSDDYIFAAFNHGVRVVAVADLQCRSRIEAFDWIVAVAHIVANKIICRVWAESNSIVARAAADSHIACFQVNSIIAVAAGYRGVGAAASNSIIICAAVDYDIGVVGSDSVIARVAVNRYVFYVVVDSVVAVLTVYDNVFAAVFDVIFSGAAVDCRVVAAVVYGVRAVAAEYADVFAAVDNGIITRVAQN